MKKLILALLFVSASASADYTGTLFELDSNQQKKIYTYSNTQIEKDGLTDQTVTYKDLNGAELFVEKSVLKGAEFIKLELTHYQLSENATVEIKDGRVYFTKILAGGKVKKSDEKLGKNFVISANFSRFIKENWADILAGKEVSFRFGSWERMETVGFEIFKVSEEKKNGQDLVVLKMKPSSFVIAALVKPLFFKFTSDGSRLIEMKGRVPLKQKSGDTWKDLDAEVVYSY
ncbi:MAG: hypothetical protein BroJett040_26130 [Oligoflexia bacterium]|nr:MAG: hypothetical protein BroJett040_26130 [Oligoflexia bacterium]